MADEMQITITDIRKAGHCGRLRPFFRQHGLDAEFRAMIKGGSIDAAKLIATGDPRALNVVERTRARLALPDG